MADAISNSVRRAVWPWDAPAAKPVDIRPRLRRKATIQAVVMLLVSFLFYRFDHRIPAFLLTVLAAVTLILGQAAPFAFQAMDRGMQKFGAWVGQGVTWLLLAPFFYLVFAPARLVLAIRGKDPMHRQFPGREPSYWTPPPPVKSPDDYRKQF